MSSSSKEPKEETKDRDAEEMNDSDAEEMNDSDAEEPEEEEQAPTMKKVSEEELRRKVSIPEYLRTGMVVAMRSMEVNDGLSAADRVRKFMSEKSSVEVPEAPLIVLMDCRSDRRRHIRFRQQLKKIINVDQVFNLSIIQPSHFVQYGLTFLESYGKHDDCALVIHKKLRVLVAGGYETVELVLKTVENILHAKKPVTPVGIIPFGIWNDLSRSIGWGSSIPSTASAVKHFLRRAAFNPVQALDSWRIDLITKENGLEEKPYSPLELCGEYFVTQGDDIQTKLPENVSRFKGIFYCYFTVGVDAHVARAFRDQVNLDEGRISNKLTYARCSCSQGWSFTPCTRTTKSRKLKDILSLYIKGFDKRKWKQIPVPESIKAIAFLNIDSYEGGRHPWGFPTPEYLEEKKFYEANPADGLLEIIGLKHGCHASLVMLKLISAKRIAQAAEIKVEFHGGVWDEAYMQMDERVIRMTPTNSVATVVKIERHQFQALVIRGKVEKTVKKSQLLGI